MNHKDQYQHILKSKFTVSFLKIQQEKGTEQRSRLGLSLLQLKYMFCDQSKYLKAPQQSN